MNSPALWTMLLYGMKLSRKTNGDIMAFLCLQGKTLRWFMLIKKLDLIKLTSWKLGICFQMFPSPIFPEGVHTQAARNTNSLVHQNEGSLWNANRHLLCAKKMMSSTYRNKDKGCALLQIFRWYSPRLNQACQCSYLEKVNILTVTSKIVFLW